MSSRTPLVAVALVVLVGGVASAAELFSPSLPALAGQFLECRIVNTSAVAQTVRIRMYASTGALVADSGDQTVAERGFFGISVPGVSAGSHCRFTTSGAKSLFRASIDVLAAGGGSIVVALPAQ